MIKLKSLLTEEIIKKLSLQEFSDTFLYAYVSLFDVDKENIKIIDVKESGAPAFCHLYYVLKLNILYKLKTYSIYHKFYYYKIPLDEIEGLSHSEWVDMLYQTARFDPVYIDKNSLKDKNKLYRFTTRVYEGEITKNITYKDFIKFIDIGEHDDLHSLKDIVLETKRIIDSYNSGNNEEEPEISPVPVDKLKLVKV